MTSQNAVGLINEGGNCEPEFLHAPGRLHASGFVKTFLEMKYSNKRLGR
jgi:hypothetical protein